MQCLTSAQNQIEMGPDNLLYPKVPGVELIPPAAVPYPRWRDLQPANGLKMVKGPTRVSLGAT